MAKHSTTIEGHSVAAALAQVELAFIIIVITIIITIIIRRAVCRIWAPVLWAAQVKRPAAQKLSKSNQRRWFGWLMMFAHLLAVGCLSRTQTTVAATAAAVPVFVV